MEIKTWLLVSFELGIFQTEFVIIYHLLISKVFEQETETIMCASNSLQPGSNAVLNAQCQVGHCE